jgi:hypothetical protein
MSIDVNAQGLQVNAIVTPQAPLAGTAVCTTANTNYTDTPTNSQALVATQAKGARVTKITALARATPTATELQLFRSPDGGTTKRFIKSVVMPAYTVAQTTAQTAIDFGYNDATNPLILAAGESLYVAIGVSNTGIVFNAEGGSY